MFCPAKLFAGVGIIVEAPETLTDSFEKGQQAADGTAKAPAGSAAKS